MWQPVYSDNIIKVKSVFINYCKDQKENAVTKLYFSDNLIEAGKKVGQLQTSSLDEVTLFESLGRSKSISDKT
jgi:hypothetical protein